MHTRKPLQCLLAVLPLMPLAAQPSAADEHYRGREHRDEHERREGWHGDIHRFHEHDLARWRAGQWYHGRRDGRLGWWWIAGGVWYFYPAPVYPYPDPYQPPVVVVPSPPSPVAQQYWYYCSNPPGYYPYVPQCMTGWERVPAAVSPGPPPR